MFGENEIVHLNIAQKIDLLIIPQNTNKTKLESFAIYGRSLTADKTAKNNQCAACHQELKSDPVTNKPKWIVFNNSKLHYGCFQCKQCNNPVAGVWMNLGGNPYHEGCFKCLDCKKNLENSDEGYCIVGDKIYCKRCGQKQSGYNAKKTIR